MDRKKSAREFLDKFLEESSLSQRSASSGESDSWIKERNMTPDEQELKRRKNKLHY